ncbi:MerR family transcriptional regulator [Nocardioides sp. C4-1]|uniref:MerR family transcriptional regulator n=1 Tax=Nocardioides sp. C4-1 TaxID=3151851 RepID=UPI0032633F9C
MAWSTAELADLAGTSLRAVRHYHAVGLLDVPERGPNGWKRYRLEHLARLREIVRLRELGLSIAKIDELVHGGSLTAALARLDEQLDESLRRLQELRAEVATLARAGVHSAALPLGLHGIDLDALSTADHSFLVLAGCLLDRASLDAFVDLLRAAYAEPALVAFDALPAEADEGTRSALVEAMVEPTRRVRAAYPTLEELAERGSTNPARALKLMRAALDEQNNAAQRDVLRRLEARLAAGGAEVAAR